MPRPFRNRLNDLDPKSWLKFQKSWFVHNPPPRRKDVLRHPAKFPETLAQEFIEFFTQSGGVVLDPMAGTGSTLVAALRCGRHSLRHRAEPGLRRDRPAGGGRRAGLPGGGRRWPEGRRSSRGTPRRSPRWPAASACRPSITSSPRRPTGTCCARRAQRHRRERRTSPELDVFYSDDPDDLGNIDDYDEFLERLVCIYSRAEAIPATQGLPDDHRQERQERRPDLPAGLGPGTSAWARSIRSRMKRSGARMTSAWRRMAWATPGSATPSTITACSFAMTDPCCRPGQVKLLRSTTNSRKPFTTGEFLVQLFCIQ